MGLDLFRLGIRVLVLVWVFIAWQDGLSDALWSAAGGIFVIWLMFRWTEKIVKR